ncbi:MAG: hypothetical protein KJO30_07770 [Boseongicola sp.]|nr:hypothetical protein [Boseongicola sp.]NNJ69567.1 hypothetical protein [Boseongicola sp.]
MDELSAPNVTAKFGFFGFILGAISLVILVVQMSALFEPEPEKSAATTIGEIAAEIKDSAARALSGEPAPVAPPPPPSYGPMITIVALVMAGAAMISGGIALYRHEPTRLPVLAIGFGTSAIVMHFVFWLALLICGIVLLVSIMNNLGDILPS